MLLFFDSAWIWTQNHRHWRRQLDPLCYLKRHACVRCKATAWHFKCYVWIYTENADEIKIMCIFPIEDYYFQLIHSIQMQFSIKMSVELIIVCNLWKVYYKPKIEVIFRQTLSAEKCLLERSFNTRTMNFVIHSHRIIQK